MALISFPSLWTTADHISSQNDSTVVWQKFHITFLWPYVSLIKESLTLLAELPSICRGETTWITSITKKPTQFTASRLNQQPVTLANWFQKELFLCDFNLWVIYNISPCLQRNHYRFTALWWEGVRREGGRETGREVITAKITTCIILSVTNLHL